MECVSESRGMRFENIADIVKQAHVVCRANTGTRQDTMIGNLSRVNDKGNSVETEEVETVLEVGKRCRLDVRGGGRETVGFPLRSTPTMCVS